MGLQSQLTDVSSDSIPILLLALIASCVNHLRSLFTSVFHSVSLSSPSPSPSPSTPPLDHPNQISSLGSGLAGLIALSEQLNLNNGRSFQYRKLVDGDGDGDGDGPDCVFCLCRLKDGDRVRQLACRHVFHKDCLDGWIDQMKFNCPLCRSPFVPDWRVDPHDQRVAVAHEVASWFAVR